MCDEYATLEPSKALINALLYLLSLHTHLYTRLRIVE